MHTLLRWTTTMRALVLAVLVLGLTTPPSGAFAAMVTVDFGAVGNGTTDDRAAWVLADAATPGEIVATAGHTYRIASNLTITSPVYFAGGKLKPDSGVTVTLAGGVLAGETQQLFDISAGGIVNVNQTPQWADWWGTAHNGSTDDSTEIQAAITSVGVNNGGKLMFGSTVYAIATGLTNIYNNVLLQGAGQGFSKTGAPDYDQAATVLLWTGNAGGTMYNMGPAVSSQHGVAGGGIVGIFFEGNQVAGTAVLIRSVKNGLFDFVVEETTTVGVDITVENTVSVSPPDTQVNWFRKITVIQQTAGSGIGMRLSGGTSSDTSLNHFGLLRLLHYNGVALDCGQSDFNLFQEVHVFRHASGTATGVILRAGTSPAYCRDSTFVTLGPGVGGLVSQGTASGTTTAKHNTILHYSIDNGDPLPTVEMGSELHYFVGDGNFRIDSLNDAAALELRQSTNTASSLIGDVKFSAYNSSSAATNYGLIRGVLGTNTAGAEVGTLRVVTKNAGADVIQAYFRDGMNIGTPSQGGFRGVGTLDLQADLYKDGSNKTGLNAPTYGTTVTVNQRLGHAHRITATNGTAFTVSNPTNSVTGDIVTVMVRNTSGGVLGVLTWGGSYKLGAAWVQPANGFSRTIQFLNDGTNWVEINRTAVNVAN